MKAHNRAAILTFSLFLSACSHDPGYEIVKEPTPKYEYEVVTVEQQATADVMATPTRFTVPYSSDAQSWERARLFLGRYTTMSIPQVSAGPSSVKLSNGSGPSDKDKYVYQIEKSNGREGVVYVVKCTPRGSGGTPALAERNARNLSRFIKDGHLEVSLLDR
jgi:hypothetical protein